MTDDLNLPFQDGADFQLDLSDADLSGGVVVMACVAPVEGGGPAVPVVVFRFTKADGSGFLRPIVLGANDLSELRSLVPLVAAAVDAAIEAAS